MKRRIACIVCVCLLCGFPAVQAAELGGSGVANGWTLGSGGILVDAILDEDAMTSDDSNALATQQSIKAYVDANAGGGGGGASFWTAETTFSRSDDDTISVTTDDCTAYAAGSPIRFKATAGSYMYAVTTACTDNGSTITVDIDGIAFSTAVDDVLEWGDPSRLRVKTLVMPGNCAVDDPFSLVLYHQERTGYLVRSTGKSATAPAGSALAFNVEVNNADAFSSEISITAGSTAEFDSGVTAASANYDLNFGESLHISTSQCGSSTPGGNPLTFTLTIIIP